MRNILEKDYKKRYNIKEALTDAEYSVFELMSLGLNYRDIASILNKEPKQVDNAIQRIKIKIKKILETRN